MVLVLKGNRDKKCCGVCKQGNPVVRSIVTAAHLMFTAVSYSLMIQNS